ncbi:hypothetical protein EXIGLDRAFT_179019 [Exidia glandulosa HHB12029]|uniref:Uncharacterized protein n=1 Tax=Exidia glandulosa HHB12029 TaxID=1314781 RepID=A0A165F470_EXIGL|nr:hypothetical protein EXIGLDRAFT_179019 [Exidia glandulosa HHB12029]
MTTRSRHSYPPRAGRNRSSLQLRVDELAMVTNRHTRTGSRLVIDAPSTQSLDHAFDRSTTLISRWQLTPSGVATPVACQLTFTAPSTTLCARRLWESVGLLPAN